MHEVYIHRRLPVRLPAVGYLDWLRDAHRVHHRHGAGPYGMLLPLVSRDLRRGARDSAAAGRDPLSCDPRSRRRPARWRAPALPGCGSSAERR